MNKISFRCNCGAQFVGKSHIYKTACKQLHKAGWADVNEPIWNDRHFHVKRVCPQCQAKVQPSQPWDG